MASLKLRHVSKVRRDGTHILKDFSLDIKDGEFIIFTGPANSGKSMLVQMIAGLADVSSGEIYIDDVCVNDLDTKDRNVAMLFKNYTLYPGVNVYDNLAIGLRMNQIPENIIDEKIRKISGLLNMDELLDHYPNELSIIEKHKVGIGRALVREPKILLMDDPLYDFTGEGRLQLRKDVARVHAEYNTTIIYMTGYAQGALELGSEIVVLRDGQLQQIGSPEELLKNPVNDFVKDYFSK